jgi:hypothetical protein
LRTDRCHCVPAEPGAGGLTGDKAPGSSPRRVVGRALMRSHLIYTMPGIALRHMPHAFSEPWPRLIAGESIRRMSTGGPAPRCSALFSLPAMCIAADGRSVARFADQAVASGPGPCRDPCLAGRTGLYVSVRVSCWHSAVWQASHMRCATSFSGWPRSRWLLLIYTGPCRQVTRPPVAGGSSLLRSPAGNGLCACSDQSPVWPVRPGHSDTGRRITSWCWVYGQMSFRLFRKPLPASGWLTLSQISPIEGET